MQAINKIVTFDEVYWTFASRRKHTEYAGESSVDIRQLAKVKRVYWRKVRGKSPMVKVHFAKSYWRSSGNPSTADLT